MKGNKSKMEGERTKSFFPQSLSIVEAGEVCKDDEYYLGIVDSYFYTQKGEKGVEA